MRRFACSLAMVAVTALWCGDVNACFMRKRGRCRHACVNPRAGPAIIEVQVSDDAKL
jgi:hypothetical protein